jgi:hypothetical protein
VQGQVTATVEDAKALLKAVDPENKGKENPLLPTFTNPASSPNQTSPDLWINICSTLAGESLSYARFLAYSTSNDNTVFDPAKAVVHQVRLQLIKNSFHSRKPN